MVTQPPQVVGLRAARHALGISDETIRRYLRAGLINGFRLPTGVWRVPSSEIDRIRAGSDTQERG